MKEQLILEITEHNESAVNRDEQGNIIRFWLYNDSTNPMNQSHKENYYWDVYWSKLKRLAKLEIPRNKA